MRVGIGGPIYLTRPEGRRRPRGWFAVPFLEHSGFVGREDELSALHATLMERGKAGIRPAGLTGMGGVGKTQLAVAYAYRYRGHYPGGVFWVNAAEPLGGGFAGLGVLLRPGVAERSREERVRAAFEELDARGCPVDRRKSG